MTAEIDATTKRKVAEREAAMRRAVYPRRVADNKMTQIAADREIAVMDAIAADYRAIEAEIIAKERLL